MIYIAPAVPVVSVTFKVSLLSVVTAAVPMDIMLSMVVGATTIAYGYLEYLFACDHAAYFPHNWDDHCVDYVLMGPAALIAQQGHWKAWLKAP